MGQLEDMHLFIRVAETGSFTAAAAEAGLSQPSVSRRISALETRLAARLLARTTRALTLTEAGRIYLDHARAAREAVAQADAAVAPEGADLQGRIRMAAPIAFARLHLVGPIATFLGAHPKVSVDLVTSDRAADLVGEGIDVAIRLGTLTEAGLVRRPLGRAPRITLAHPDHVARHGRPAHPLDLRRHPCVLYTGMALGRTWTFQGPDGADVAVTVDGPLSVDTTEAMRAAALAGLGVSLSAAWAWSEELADGRMVRVLEGWDPPPLPIQAVYPSGRLIAPRVRALVDHLADSLARVPGIGG